MKTDRRKTVIKKEVRKMSDTKVTLAEARAITTMAGMHWGRDIKNMENALSFDAAIEQLVQAAADEALNNKAIPEGFHRIKDAIHGSVVVNKLFEGDVVISNSEDIEYPACDRCGSPEVSADAAARWDHTKQDWVTTNVFDKGHHCDSCENECKIKWVKGNPEDWEPEDENHT